MAMGSQQLAENLGQLKDFLELYPSISIIKTDGQPPDNYEIEYNIRGFVKDTTNAIVIDTKHRIRLSLPFGYPHFAPIAKPLTSIFHPDFDPAAIRIADQWQQNPSLPELVLYIGEMISGSIYNLEDPFNQEAAEWYTTHKHQLPLDSLSVFNIEESAAGLDALANDSFASLGLEIDTFLEPKTPVAPSKIEHIRDLITQNKVFTANKLLADLPEHADFPDREDLQQHIGKVLRKTDQLFKLAEQLKDMSKINEAIEVVDNLLSIAIDAPGAKALHTRLEQSFHIDQSDDTPQKKKKNGQTGKPKDTVKSTQSLSKSTAKSSFLGKAIPYKPLLATILILGGCIGAISLFFKDQNALSQSQANLLKSHLLIEKKEFAIALETLDIAKTALADLTILRLRKNSLEHKINTLIASTDLQEGLKGRILYQGEYIPAGTAASLAELTVLTDQAQVMAKQNKVQEALTLYRQALKFATEHNLEKQKGSINENIQPLELRSILLLAEKEEQEKNWTGAADAYRKALKISGNIEDIGTTNDVTHRLTTATFRHEMDQSKKAFTQSQWQETIKFLKHAQQAMTASPNIATEKERQDLNGLLLNSQLYLTLSTAREFYQQNKWDLAINEYQNALNLLANESGNMENSLAESISKIEITLLMVKIAQIQNKVFVAEGSADMAASLSYCKEIQRLIRSSKYENDPAVKAVMQKINDKTEKIQEKISFNEKIAWLEQHYEEIFRANFPAFQKSKFLQPKAIFLKKISGKPVFTLNCTERGQGSSSKLELNYMFDAGTGKWSVYSGQ